MMKMKLPYSLSPLLTKEPKTPMSIFFRHHSVTTEAAEIPAPSVKHLLLSVHRKKIFFYQVLRQPSKSENKIWVQKYLPPTPPKKNPTYPEVGLLPWIP